jgi:hypothetical protein
MFRGVFMLYPKIKPRNAISVIYKPPMYKENEIPLSDLSDNSKFKPCGIETANGMTICVTDQKGILVVQDMETLEILQYDDTVTLKGVIQKVQADYGLKNVYLFESSKELKKWSK